MIFKYLGRREGGHIHTTVFCGKSEKATFQNLGVIIMSPEQFEALKLGKFAFISEEVGVCGAIR